ncbi:MAG TPA: hypothetical protein VNQ77_00795 [Frankiaceae bacterium]|nr:hypothetical protein [Frankiaceae bacterium]
MPRPFVRAMLVASVAAGLALAGASQAVADDPLHYILDVADPPECVEVELTPPPGLPYDHSPNVSVCPPVPS